MPYEMTQVRVHLKRYMQKIKDNLTTEADLRHYETLVEKLQALALQTDRHFGQQTIPFTAEDRAALRERYTEAVEAVAALLAEEETGAVGLRLRLIGRELTPLLLADMQAIELTGQDPELGQRSLPELLSKVRAAAAPGAPQAPDQQQAVPNANPEEPEHLR